MANLTNSSLLEFQNPGAMNDELFRVPGIAHELMNLTLANAPRPNRPLALMGALAGVAHLAGRTYEDEHGLHANMYLVALAPTGMGKEEPRQTNRKLVEAAGARESVPDTIASPEGLEDALVRSPALLVQNDEADALFGAMSQGGLRAAKLNATFLRLYSQSRGSLVTRLKANETAGFVVEKPHLTLFATGVGEYVYRALTPKSLTDGLLGRCLFIETESFCRLGEMQNLPLPSELAEAARWMRERERAFAETGVYRPLVVGTTLEAKDAIREMKTWSDDLAEEALSRELFVASALFCRMSEKIQKLALIGAISQNPYEPVISRDAVMWATALVVFATRQMLTRSAFYVAEGSFGKLKGRALAMLAKHGGSLDRSTFLKNLNIPLSVFKNLIVTLSASGLVEIANDERGKVIYSLIRA